MSNKLWFRRKTYGWGWTPATNEGWLAVLVYVSAISLYPLLTEAQNSEFSVATFFVIAALSTLVLLTLCFVKGEKPSWRWGNDKKV